VRFVRVGALLFALVALAGCRVDAQVDITVDAHGNGTLRTTITLDAPALLRVGGFDAAARQVPLDDLRDAGWHVSPWTRGAGGTASVTLTHEFHGRDELAELLRDLVGDQGVLRDPRLTHDRGWFSTKDTFSIVVDLHAPTTGIGSDADLSTRLRLAGIDPKSLDASLTDELRRSLHVTVTAHLPGGQTRSIAVTAPSRTTLQVVHEHREVAAIAKVIVAILLVAVAAVLLWATHKRGRRAKLRAERQSARERLAAEPAGELHE